MTLELVPTDIAVCPECGGRYLVDSAGEPICENALELSCDHGELDIEAVDNYRNWRNSFWLPTDHDQD